MSSLIPNDPTPFTEFQSHYGAHPGGQDPKTECKQWEQLCGELLALRARLQTELARTQAENKANERAIVAILFKDDKFEMTMEEVLAQVDKSTSLPQIIANLRPN